MELAMTVSTQHDTLGDFRPQAQKTGGTYHNRYI